MADKRVIGGEVKEMMEGWRLELVGLRRDRGVTQGRVAREAGVNPGYISMVEGGHARMTWRLLRAYLEILKMEIGPREKGS